MVQAYAASCRNHPEREALGICVECRTRVCAECVTKVEGINYCVACLAKLAAAGDKREATVAAVTSPGLAWLSASALFLFAALLAWGLVEVAMPGSGW
jgi:hypothetical protein